MEISDVQAKIEMLQLLISTLQSMNAAPEDVRSAQKQLVTLLTEHLGKLIARSNAQIVLLLLQ